MVINKFYLETGSPLVGKPYDKNHWETILLPSLQRRGYQLGQALMAMVWPLRLWWGCLCHGFSSQGLDLLDLTRVLSSSLLSHLLPTPPLHALLISNTVRKPSLFFCIHLSPPPPSCNISHSSLPYLPAPHLPLWCRCCTLVNVCVFIHPHLDAQKPRKADYNLTTAPSAYGSASP